MTADVPPELIPVDPGWTPADGRPDWLGDDHCALLIDYLAGDVALIVPLSHDGIVTLGPAAAAALGAALMTGAKMARKIRTARN